MLNSKNAVRNTSGIDVDHRVCHRHDPSLTGTVRHVDHGYETFGVTTAEVEWDDDPGSRDIQWTNRLEHLS